MFPIRLTAFEEYFLVNDYEESPSTYLFRIEFAGAWNVEAGRQALQSTVALHPLAQCTVDYDGKGRAFWHFEPSTVSLRDIAEIRPRQYPDLPPLDIHEGPTVAVWYEQQATEHFSLVFQVHHCVFDGAGFMQFFADWFDSYLEFLGRRIVNADTTRTYDREKLTNRCRSGASLIDRVRLLPGQWKSMRATAQVLKRTTIPLIPRINDSADSKKEQKNGSFGVENRRLDLTTTSRLAELARSLGTTSNNLLIRDLFVAIRNWQREFGLSGEGTHFRVMVPMDERSHWHCDMPGCNHCTIVNFDREDADIDESTELLRGITRDMHVIRRWRLSLNFWRALRIVRLLPGGLKKRAKAEDVSATSYISNLGNLSKRFESQIKQGAELGVGIEDFEVVPTIQHGMAAAFAVFYFRDRLKLMMHYNRGMLDAEMAPRLIDLFQDQILQTSKARS